MERRPEVAQLSWEDRSLFSEGLRHRIRRRIRLAVVPSMLKRRTVLSFLAEVPVGN